MAEVARIEVGDIAKQRAINYCQEKIDEARQDNDIELEYLFKMCLRTLTREDLEL